MGTTTKVIFNVIVLYAKVVVTMIISLVSVPLILKALGASDYGLYNLVAGIVTMLSFLNNSMTVSSQRYMSVAMGAGNINRVNIIYSASFILHFFLAICVIVVLELLGVPSINQLNIDPERIRCAKLIFQFLIIGTFSKIIAVPFDAIMNAHEDLLAFSVIELIDSFLMFTIAITLQYIPIDKLAFYGFSIALIAVLTLIMKYGWCKKMYPEYNITYKGNDKILQKEMLGFAGWNLFGGLAMMGRNQGVAIVFNLFLGTLANAAYGIANQINGALLQFSSSFQRAINPQLMKSEGMGKRERLHRITFISSKFSVLALAFFAVPLIIEMDDVLQIWLHGDMPPFTAQLSRCILVMSIISQASMGLMSSIQATGNIKWYQIIMGLLLFLNVPLSYILLKIGYPIYYATIGFVLIELISFIVRLMMAKKIVGISPYCFVIKVIFPAMIIIIPSTILCLIPSYIITNIFIRFLGVFMCYVLCYVVLIWYLALDEDQRLLIKNKLNLCK